MMICGSRVSFEKCPFHRATCSLADVIDVLLLSFCRSPSILDISSLPRIYIGKNCLPFCGLCVLLIVTVLYINFLISSSSVYRILGLLPVLLEFCSQSFHQYLDFQITKGIIGIQGHRSYFKDMGLCFSEIGQLTLSILKPDIRR